MKFFSRFFAGAAILLSDIMCAVVAFNWAKMLDATTSAPASVSLIYAIPFCIGIAVCVILAAVFSRKAAQHNAASGRR